jgi:long-chain acyl-CoA synthetase
MTLTQMFDESALRHPGGIAVRSQGVGRTYESLARRAQDFAWHLVDQGVRPGDRVIVLLRNSPEYVVSYFAILGAGGVVVPLNPNSTVHELRPLLLHCEPKVVICREGAQESLGTLVSDLPFQCRMVVERELGLESADGSGSACPGGSNYRGTTRPGFPVKGDEGELALILYTSGTTGKPKGVMLTHRSLLANTTGIVEYLRLTSLDRVCVILPFFYSYGNSLLLTHVYTGGTLVLADNFLYPNQVVELMVRERVTGFSGVPSSFAMLLRRSVFPSTRFPDLRYVTSAGGALSRSQIEELRSCLRGVAVFVMYGQTEASARLSYLPPDDLDRKIGSIGRGMPGVELSVRRSDGTKVLPGEVGEIVAAGTCLMSGYWRDDEESRRAIRGGGLWTGDMATVDEEGFIFIKGRASDMIKSSSYRINPEEIEEVINSHAGIVESAVVGMADEMLGESVTAFAVCAKAYPASESAVLQYLREFLPVHKLPRRILFCGHLPRTESGKIKRQALRERLAQEGVDPGRLAGSSGVVTPPVGTPDSAP